MGLIGSWIILSLGVALATAVVPGFKVKGVANVVIVAAGLGLLNVLLGWLIALVITIATFGLALFFGLITRWIVNSILLLVLDSMTQRMDVDGFFDAMKAAAIIGVSGSVAGWLVG